MSDAYVMGGYRTDTTTGKVAKIGALLAALNNSGTCIKIAGADYAVTAGKTFYLTGIMFMRVDTGAVAWEMRYADNAALTTNPVTLLSCPSLVLSVGNLPFIIPVFGISVPAGKYLGAFSAGNPSNVGVFVIGYEV